LIYNEKGIDQNFMDQLKWCRLGAENYSALAQNALGTLYANGQGVPQDYVRAHMWFNLASAQDFLDIAKENRDKIANRMTEQQIAEAQAMAQKCVALHYKQCD
jgi:TPR repeat protein